MHKRFFKFELERGSKKIKCPNCFKKTFVRFINIETREYLPPNFGRCDREQKCGYFNAPSKESNVIKLPITYIPPKTSFVPLEHVNRQFDPDREKNNNFLIFLRSLFRMSEINTVVRNYLISTIPYWGSAGATIFWQIDEKERVRTGQIILYNSETGKRKKKPFSHIYWYHSYLKKAGLINEFNLCQCLFGLHLIKRYPQKSLIAIVEAPKTACIMSIIFPKYLWLATCGLSNLNPDLFKPLKGKTIILYPDLGAYSKWREKSKHLKKLGYNIEISDLLEKKIRDVSEGSDLADYFILQKSMQRSF